VYNIDEVKELITDEDVFLLLEHLQAEPVDHGGFITCKTICHNSLEELDSASNKLYYYSNSQRFTCFTHCGDSFDIFELVRKVQNVDLNQAIIYIVNFLNLQWKLDDAENDYSVNPDIDLFRRYNEINQLEPRENNKVLLPQIDDNIIRYFPQPRILPWEKEGISKEVCDYMNIRYNPLNGSIIIPHYDENDRLVGIRQRTLVQEDEIYGKYRPARISGKSYQHPLSFVDFGLNKSKDKIKDYGTVIVAESEKFCLQYMTMFGIENNISVACCGNNLSRYQFQLLLDSGAKEVVIAFDRDFEEVGDDNYYRVVNRLMKLNEKYKSEANISIMFDKEGLTGYKQNPLDSNSPEIFEYLFKNRIIL
jgi:DNA primase